MRQFISIQQTLMEYLQYSRHGFQFHRPKDEWGPQGVQALLEEN